MIFIFFISVLAFFNEGAISQIYPQRSIKYNKFLNIISTSGGDRTHTLLPELDFESSASTNSATEAKND